MDDMENLHHKLVFLLDSDYDHKRSKRFVGNLLKRRKEWLFNFVMDPHVEPTNNRAERALRPSVIYRKVSGGSTSVIMHLGLWEIFISEQALRM